MNWDPVHGGRRTFLACMRAMCAPGTPVELPVLPRLSARRELDGTAAILLALLDRGLSLAVAGGDEVRRVGTAVIEQTGAHLGDIAGAQWVVVHGPSADAILRARRGTRMEPDSSATVVIAATGELSPVMLAGPGIRGTTTALVPLDDMAVHALTAANSALPCGVDLLIVERDRVIALPRSVTVKVAVA